MNWKNVNLGYNYGHIGDVLNIYYIDGIRIKRIWEKESYSLNFCRKVKATMLEINKMLGTG